METISSASMAIAMIAAMALVAGGLVLLRRRETRMKGVLMLVMAAVLVANVLVWTL